MALVCKSLCLFARDTMISGEAPPASMHRFWFSVLFATICPTLFVSARSTSTQVWYSGCSKSPTRASKTPLAEPTASWSLGETSAIQLIANTALASAVSDNLSDWPRNFTTICTRPASWTWVARSLEELTIWRRMLNAGARAPLTPRLTIETRILIPPAFAKRGGMTGCRTKWSSAMILNDFAESLTEDLQT